MSGRPLRLEALDLDIFREMYRSSPVALTGIDPRLSANRIAQRLRVGRARVAGRLRAWSASGFLVQYDVWLNPALVGGQGAWLNVRADAPRSKGAVLARLGLVEGAVTAIEFLGEWVTFGCVAPDAEGLVRVRDLVRGLAGVREVDDPAPWTPVRPRHALRPLDRRIVAALRERPTATLRATAQRVGVSTRTMTRRYAELIEGSAVWFVPVFDFRAISYPCVSVLLALRPGTPAAPLARRLTARYPLTLDFGETEPSPPSGGVVAHSFLVIPPSAAHLEELEQFAASLDGVVGAETNVWVRMHPFSTWVDRELAAGVPRTDARPRSSAGRA